MENVGKNHLDRVLGMLRNFKVNLLAVVIGVLIGLYAKETAHKLIPIGKLYLAFLTMSVLPIVFSSITHSLGHMLRSGKAATYLLRLVAVFSVAVLIGSTIGVAGGILGAPGAGLDGNQSNKLGDLLLLSSDHHQPHGHIHRGMIGFLTSIIPANLFRAFSQGDSLAVTFVSILMGIALGLNRSEASGYLLHVVRGVYETFFKILNWALYALPFGLLCLMAGQVAELGTDYLLLLSKVIGVFYACCGVLCAMYFVVILYVTKLPIPAVARALRDPLTLAFVASNSLVAMPIIFKSMEEDLRQPHELIEFLVPLGIVVNRHAYPLLFALMTVFVFQVYHHPMSLAAMAEVSIAAAVSGMAAIGPAASVAPILGLVLCDMGLPSGLAMAVLIATSSILTPMVAMTHLMGSCATATLIGAKKPNHTSEQ